MHGFSSGNRSGHAVWCWIEDTVLTYYWGRNTFLLVFKGDMNGLIAIDKSILNPKNIK